MEWATLRSWRRSVFRVTKDGGGGGRTGGWSMAAAQILSRKSRPLSTDFPEERDTQECSVVRWRGQTHLRRACTEVTADLWLDLGAPPVGQEGGIVCHLQQIRGTPDKPWQALPRRAHQSARDPAHAAPRVVTEQTWARWRPATGPVSSAPLWSCHQQVEVIFFFLFWVPFMSLLAWLSPLGPPGQCWKKWWESTPLSCSWSQGAAFTAFPLTWDCSWEWFYRNLLSFWGSLLLFLVCWVFSSRF